MTMAIARLLAVAGAAEVQQFKSKLLADIQRAMTMIKNVSKDGMAPGYQGGLASIRQRAQDCTTQADLQALRDEFTALQQERRQWLCAPRGALPTFLD